MGPQRNSVHGNWGNREAGKVAILRREAGGYLFLIGGSKGGDLAPAR
jgi:hypothetical protein